MSIYSVCLDEGCVNLEDGEDTRIERVALMAFGPLVAHAKIYVDVDMLGGSGGGRQGMERKL